MMNPIRWMLVIPAGIAGWWFTLIVGLALYGLADMACPSELIVDGGCAATWHETLINLIFVACGALCAIFAMVFAVLVAPSRKTEVAAIGYLVIVLYLGYYLVTPPPLASLAVGATIASYVAGAVTLWLTIRLVRRKAPAVRSDTGPRSGIPEES